MSYCRFRVGSKQS